MVLWAASCGDNYQVFTSEEDAWAHARENMLRTAERCPDRTLRKAWRLAFYREVCVPSNLDKLLSCGALDSHLIKLIQCIGLVNFDDDKHYLWRVFQQEEDWVADWSEDMW